MSFFVPTRMKIVTALLIAALLGVHMSISKMVNEKYRERSFAVLASSRYTPDFQRLTMEYVKSIEFSQKNSDMEAAKKVAWLNRLKSATNLLIAVLISYLGSCFICRNNGRHLQKNIPPLS